MWPCGPRVPVHLVEPVEYSPQLRFGIRSVGRAFGPARPVLAAWGVVLASGVAQRLLDLPMVTRVGLGAKLWVGALAVLWRLLTLQHRATRVRIAELRAVWDLGEHVTAEELDRLRQLRQHASQRTTTRR